MRVIISLVVLQPFSPPFQVVINLKQAISRCTFYYACKCRKSCLSDQKIYRRISFFYCVTLVSQKTFFPLSLLWLDHSILHQWRGQTKRWINVTDTPQFSLAGNKEYHQKLISRLFFRFHCENGNQRPTWWVGTYLLDISDYQSLVTATLSSLWCSLPIGAGEVKSNPIFHFSEPGVS